MKLFIKIIKYICACAAIIIAAVLAIDAAVIASQKGKIRTVADENENFDCILVLGCGLKPDGTPSDMLSDRLSVALELYRSGISDLILLSGDKSGKYYNEVGAMQKFLIDKGVPEENILLDPKGYSTRESMKNASNDFNISRAVIVTQKYHLYRALADADNEKIDAVGADAELRSYRGQLFREIREIAARDKDFIFNLF